ncbi:response regulator [Geomonas sp.]|uniref:response regulator n=1 Tax=Geomonas sp. TaxID=2651584 RepID=UPI002B497228|nr:response regulator [Geomonas sp.]HJV36452.1 response regulator [Geomonas sp.]
MDKITVFIVEDEAIIAADLAEKLTTLGYQVAGVAARGEEAVEKVCKLLPAVVLMDIRLKGEMDGIEAAQAIRKRVDLPVIYLTAHSDAATLGRAKVTGPFGYLLKPFEEREVATAIELALYKHQAERQLREQREWLRVTLASIGDAVITSDTTGRTTYLNPVAEALTGWSNEEAHSRPISEVFPLVNDRTGERTDDPVAYVLREQRTRTLANHTALLTRDGREIPIEDSAAPILDAAGRVAGVVLVFHDVTEKRRAQQALQAANEELAAANEELRDQSEELIRAREEAEAANRAKSQFLANMSHELRTPMTGVIGMLDLVLMDELPTEQRDCVESARTAAHSMVRILNDILDITKIEAGKLSVEEKPFSLRRCVRDTYDILHPAARGKGLLLEARVAEELPDALNGDRTRISQVLTNLAANAVKFTEKGKVTIEVTMGAPRADGRLPVTFTVSDTGIGVPQQKRELLFREFSQVDDSHSRRFGGAGLGLAISKELVERMGGKIGFDSEEGKGSRFSFSIPLQPAAGVQPGEAVQPAPPRQATAGPLSGKRLLLVEDDETVRRTLTTMLDRFGYRIDCAENGRQAVDLWQDGRYDLVLMDVQMPVMNGFEVTGIIRERELASGGHVPIIAMTAHALKDDRENCLAAGMDGYLSKPIDFRETLETIRQALEGSATAAP